MSNTIPPEPVQQLVKFPFNTTPEKCTPQYSGNWKHFLQYTTAVYAKIRQLNRPRTRRHIEAHHSPGDSGISSDCQRNVHHSPTAEFPLNTVTLPEKCTSQSDSRISIEHSNIAREMYIPVRQQNFHRTQ